VYKKHYPPALQDEVWRLDRIGKDGAFHKRLNAANITTVEDFLRMVVMDPQKLRNVSLSFLLSSFLFLFFFLLFLASFPCLFSFFYLFSFFFFSEYSNGSVGCGGWTPKATQYWSRVPIFRLFGRIRMVVMGPQKLRNVSLVSFQSYNISFVFLLNDLVGPFAAGGPLKIVQRKTHVLGPLILDNSELVVMGFRSCERESRDFFSSDLHQHSFWIVFENHCAMSDGCKKPES
jgi:hypothetical protein